MTDTQNFDKIFKLLTKLNRNRNNPDLHSFTAKTKKRSSFCGMPGLWCLF